MVAGNTVVMNPCRHAPMPIHLFYGLMERYGLPAGVLNLIVDRRDESTQELANDMRLAGIVASGSGDRMEDLMFLQIDDEMHFINELKGMNPIVVHRPSDMKGTVRKVMESAFAFSGQRLFSCSKVIITREDQAKFTDLLTEYMKDLKIDDPVNDTAFSGPLICDADADRFRDMALRLMPFTVAKAMPVSRELSGNYVSPIAVCGLDPEDELNYMDSGLPILNISVVDSVDGIFTELENCECGLSAGIFSKDAKLIERLKGEADVPRVFVNESSRSLRPAVHAAVGYFVR
jgi:acyl-CoA reductase-like NAD-dependent aldehyde dehydrogenase